MEDAGGVLLLELLEAVVMEGAELAGLYVGEAFTVAVFGENGGGLDFCSTSLPASFGLLSLSEVGVTEVTGAAAGTEAGDGACVDVGTGADFVSVGVVLTVLSIAVAVVAVAAGVGVALFSCFSGTSFFSSSTTVGFSGNLLSVAVTDAVTVAFACACACACPGAGDEPSPADVLAMGLSLLNRPIRAFSEASFSLKTPEYLSSSSTRSSNSVFWPLSSDRWILLLLCASISFANFSAVFKRSLYFGSDVLRRVVYSFSSK